MFQLFSTAFLPPVYSKVNVYSEEPAVRTSCFYSLHGLLHKQREITSCRDSGNILHFHSRTDAKFINLCKEILDLHKEESRKSHW